MDEENGALTIFCKTLLQLVCPYNVREHRISSNLQDIFNFHYSLWSLSSSTAPGMVLAMSCSHLLTVQALKKNMLSVNIWILN